MERRVQRGLVENARTTPRKLKRERSKTSSTLKWNNVHAEATRKALSTPSMNVKDYDPVYALRKIAMLYERDQNEEVGRIISDISSETLLQIYKDFPMDLFMESIPQSLVILDSLFSSLFLYNPDNFPSDDFDLNALVMNIVKLYVRGQSEDLPRLKNWDKMRRHCKNILKIIGYVKGTSVSEMLRHRHKCLHRAAESLGKHGLVEVEITPSSEENIIKKLLSLSEAVGVELERMIVNSKCAIHKLTTMERNPIVDMNSTLKRPAKTKSQHQTQATSAPSELSHQRVIGLTSSDIQERLYQNKTLLNVVEPVMQYAQLPWLLTTLQERIGRDKDILLTFSQLRKELPSVSPDAKLFQVLLQYSQAFSTVIDLIKEYVKDDPEVHLSGEDKRFNPFVPEANHSEPLHISAKSGTWSTGHSSAEQPVKPTKENHVSSSDNVTAERECSRLQRELHRAQQVIEHLRKREKDLVNRLSKQAETFISKSANFENIEAGIQRPTELVRRYRNLYSEGRVQAFDAIDEILQKEGKNGSGVRVTDIKSKLLFSVIVLSFRSIADTLDNIYIQMRKLLCMSTASAEKRITKETELTIQSYLRNTGDTFDVSANFTDVFDRVCDALFECPELRTSASLQSYVSECTRLAWLLSIQMPPFTIEYDATYFDSACHERFHTSDNTSTEITSFLWPSLLEKQSGKCICKGIVVTG